MDSPPRRSPFEWLDDPRAPLLFLALAVAAIWLISRDSHLTFVADDWDFLVKRQGASLGFLNPFKGTAIGPALFFILHGNCTLANLAKAPVQVILSRFAGQLSVSLVSLDTGESAALSIPVDNSTRPWGPGLKGAGPIRLCTTAQRG